MSKLLSLQQVGTQILTGAPGKFYIFTGCEYGIKSKYIQILADHYGNMIESPSVQNILNLMRTKRLIPLAPTLYVVRYDEEFLSSLSDKTSDQIAHTNIIGTIVCLYEQPKHCNKVEKYLPNYTVQIDHINPQFIEKYLRSDFPELPDNFLHLISQYSENYGQAKNIARCMSVLDLPTLSSYTDDELLKLFGRYDISTDSQIRVGIAARNFSYLIKLAESYDGPVDNILYTILSTMIELDKLQTNKYTESPIRPYVKLWTPEDIYHMFMNTYDCIKSLRSSSGCDPKDRLLYIFSLIQFIRIPAVGVLQCS